MLKYNSPIIQLVGLQLAFLFCIPFVHGQDSDTKVNRAILELKRLADSAYGSNHELLNGRVYYQNNLSATGTPLFLSMDWLPGSVTINQKTFNNLELKYNIETDELILKAIQKSGMSSAIVLNPYLISSFSLGKNNFINASQFPENLFSTHFVQLIYSGKILFLATYSKSFLKDFSDKSPYGKYSEQQSVYSIYNNQVLTKIASKKALLDYFDPHKKEIKKYLKHNKFKFKKASPSEWYSVIQFCDNLQTTGAK